MGPKEDGILLPTRMLTHVVRDGLPAGTTAALEFQVSGSGKITS